MSAIEAKEGDLTLSTETLESFIKKTQNVKISHKAYFLGFKQRIKVEFLKSFIV